MNVKLLIFGIILLLALWFSRGFSTSAFEVTAIVAIIAIGVGIWFFARGIGGGK